MRLRLVIVLAAVGLVACAADSGVEPQDHCLVPDGLLDRTRPLPRTQARISAGDPLRIVAIGSSSTAGAGASMPSRSYPARLEAELRARFPENRIEVINKGVNGRWKDTLTAEDNARYEAMARSELGDACAQWLQTGQRA